MSLDLKVVADWSNHKQLSSISPQNDLSLVEPSMCCEVTLSGQFFDLLVSFEGVVFYFEQFEYVPSCATDQMGLGWTYGDGVSSLDTEIADC
jgi:hypothetical protein